MPKKKNKKNLENIVEKKKLIAYRGARKENSKDFPGNSKTEKYTQDHVYLFSMLTILDRRDDLFIRASSRKELSVTIHLHRFRDKLHSH